MARALVISMLLGFGIFMAKLSYERNFTHVYDNQYQAMLDYQKKYTPQLDKMICDAAEDLKVTPKEHLPIFNWIMDNQGFYSAYTPDSKYTINARERFFSMAGELCSHKAT